MSIMQIDSVSTADSTQDIHTLRNIAVFWGVWVPIVVGVLTIAIVLIRS